MTIDGWRPLSQRERGTHDSEYDGPFDGVPDWLMGSLWSWVADRLPIYDRGSLRHRAVEEYRAVARALRISIDDPTTPDPRDARSLQNELYRNLYVDRDLLLDAVDYLLAHVVARTLSRGAIVALESMLTQAGSVWTVTDTPGLGLTRRVAAEEAAEAADVMARAGRAGELIGNAWRAAYGRDPNPTTAYREAVRAVESAAIPVVSPRNRRATLGTMIGDLRANPDKWTVLLGEQTGATAVEAVAGTMELLWKGQHDRHGTAEENAPIGVSQAEAEAAVQLAILLVRWFSNDTVRVVS